jgi:hypothetical protein
MPDIALKPVRRCDSLQSQFERLGTLRNSQIPQLLDTHEAAKILGRSAATLKRWRCEGIGPNWMAFASWTRAGSASLKIPSFSRQLLPVSTQATLRTLQSGAGSNE